MSDKIKEKYIATMLLHAVGDTIGFKNGDWEFYHLDQPIQNLVLEKLYEFINLGGINDINLKNWRISDDTILHHAIAKSLLSTYNSMDELENNTVGKMCNAYNKMLDDKHNDKDRYMGESIARKIAMINDKKNWREFEFDPLGGGNGVAMRSNCIGLAFFGEENRNKLIQYSIMSGRITHVNPIGWLGGLSTALFTAFVLENVHIYKWIPKMLKIIGDERVKKYLNADNRNELNAYYQFVNMWKSYFETRFSNNIPIVNKTHIDVVQRAIFYNNLFSEDNFSNKTHSGYAAVIIAYDCLLDAQDSWEKLIIYSILNTDSDTVCSIACALFGTLYGLEKIPIKNMEFIENKDKTIKIGTNLYRKYFLMEKI